MALRKPSLREIRQAERDARELARAVLAGSKGDLRRVSGAMRQRVQALVTQAGITERQRQRDVAALRKILLREGRKPKRKGKGLAKQVREYRPQIEAGRKRRSNTELSAIVSRPSGDGETIPFIAKGGKLIYIQSDNPAVRGELIQIWTTGKYRPSNLYRWEGKSFRDDRTGKRYKVETDMNVVQAAHDVVPSDYHKRVYRRARKAAA